jgi:hypothetical protein
VSSGKMETIFHEDLEKLLESDLDRDVDISQLVIPFSKMFKSYKPRDVYSGNENIPFKERETEFKMIFRQEFSEFLR